MRKAISAASRHPPHPIEINDATRRKKTVAIRSRANKNNGNINKNGSNPWIRARLHHLQAEGKNKTQTGLAAALGVAKARINEMIDGRSYRDGAAMRIDAVRIPALASYLEMDELHVISSIVGPRLLPRAARQCLVRGLIEEGVFRQTPQAANRSANGQAMVMSPFLPNQVRLPGNPEQVAFRVNDMSCAEIYPQGSYLLTIALSDLGRALRPGDRVIVERRIKNRFEFTCRELRIDNHLWPLANIPGPWRTREFIGLNGRTHKAVAIVVAAHIVYRID